MKGPMSKTGTKSAAELSRERIERQKRVGLAIRRARGDKTQTELGQLLAPYLGEEVPQTTVSRWEVGSVSIDLEQLRAIELALKLRAGTLFSSTGYVPKDISPREVEQMIALDPNLSDSLRDNVISLYRTSVKMSKEINGARRRR